MVLFALKKPPRKVRGGFVARPGLPASFHYAVIPQQFDLPKAFQLNASRSVGFFNAPPLNQASLFRGFALKKPVTFVTGFVARPGFEPGTSGL